MARQRTIQHGLHGFQEAGIVCRPGRRGAGNRRSQLPAGADVHRQNGQDLRAPKRDPGRMAHLQSAKRTGLLGGGLSVFARPAPRTQAASRLCHAGVWGEHGGVLDSPRNRVSRSAPETHAGPFRRGRTVLPHQTRRSVERGAEASADHQRPSGRPPRGNAIRCRTSTIRPSCSMA